MPDDIDRCAHLEMTLITALRCRDGVILGSDSQETRGGRGRRIARPTQKVYEPRPGFLLAWAGAQDKPVALHLFSGGASEWVGAWAFGGIALGVEGATFAVGAMRYINPGTLTLEQAKIVSLKVLRDTIEASVEGIGGRGQMATAHKSGREVIEDADMRGLHDTVDLWEAQCAELLLGSSALPSASDTPDRGVRPPG